MLNRRCERLAESDEPVVKGVVVDSCQSSRLLQRHALIVEHDQAVPSRVVGLHVPGRPSTVTRLVVAGRVDAVDGQPFGGWSHIGKEGCEIVAPSVAHDDPSRSVLGVGVRTGRVAPALHRSPRAVLLSVLAREQAPVLRVASGAHRLLLADTTGRVATEKVLAVLHGDRAAVAGAQPVRALAACLRLAAKHGKSAKSLACKVLGSRHRHMQLDAAVAPCVSSLVTA